MQCAFADSLDVKGYKIVPNDLAATQYPRYDANDDQCAIIKVISDIDGLLFDSGIGIVGDIERKAGEYWIYVSPGERRLSIWGPDILKNNFNLPDTPKSGKVYQLIVTRAGEGGVGDITTGFILLKSGPPGARVYIDGEFMGNTPFQREMASGFYNYRLEKEMFYFKEGSFTVKVNETYTESVNLDPNFGALVVTSSPVNGAKISLNGQPTGYSTPYTFDTLKSGSYILTFQIDLYEPITREVTINDGESKRLDIQLSPVFGNIEITTSPAADIYIDGRLQGNDAYSGILTKGVHSIEAKRENYYPQTTKIDMKAGVTETVPFELLPITGSLSVISDPPEAEIFIDGKSFGLSPRIIPDIVIGHYEIILKKENFATVSTYADVKENERTEVIANLENFKEITIVSNPMKASLTLNGKNEGETPKKIVVPFGENMIKLSLKGYEDLETSFLVTEQKDKYGFEMISDLKAQAKIDFSKYKRRKNWWLGGTIASALAGGYFYYAAEKHYDEYQTATENATDLHNQIKTEDMIWPAAFGLSGFCAIMTIVNGSKQGKAKRNMNISLVPVEGGGMMSFSLKLN